MDSVCSNPFHINCKNTIDYRDLTEYEKEKYGKELIQNFISKIDTKEYDSLSFDHHGMFFKKVLKGVYYVNCIEMMLKTYTSYYVNREIVDKSFDFTDMQEPRQMTHDDMVAIKKIYKDWWKKNKHKSILQLQKEHGRNVNPLTGTNYKLN